MAKQKSLTAAVDSALQSKFSLSSFKSKKGLDNSSKFKAQEWIPFTPALAEALSLPGVPKGHVTVTMDYRDWETDRKSVV